MYSVLFTYSWLSFGSVKQVQKKAGTTKKPGVFLLAAWLEVLPKKGGGNKMGNRPSFDSVAALWHELSAKEQLALVNSDNRPALKAFLQNPSGVAGKPASVPVELYSITVDYSQSLAEMIAAGHYDWTNSDITAEHFPIKGTGAVEVKTQLVHLNRHAMTREVMAELDRRGLRPATIEELLAFGAKYPDMQRQFEIIALGSCWVIPDDCLNVPCLCKNDGGRGLGLRWGYPSPGDGCGWDGDYRFLAVSK
jgi:hypothetical protein